MPAAPGDCDGDNLELLRRGAPLELALEGPAVVLGDLLTLSLIGDIGGDHSRGGALKDEVSDNEDEVEGCVDLELEMR